MKPTIVSIAIIIQMFLHVQAVEAEPPPCGDPEILESLHTAAADEVTPSTKSVGNVFIDRLDAVLIPNGEFDTRVTEMFTLSRSEDTRECQATLHLVEPGRVDGTTPIYYSVVRTEDGKSLFMIKPGQPLLATLFRSIEANNHLTETTDAIRRELLGSASIKSQVQQFMQANPSFNAPSPSNSTPGSHFRSVEGR